VGTVDGINKLPAEPLRYILRRLNVSAAFSGHIGKGAGMWYHRLGAVDHSSKAAVGTFMVNVRITGNQYF